MYWISKGYLHAILPCDLQVMKFEDLKELGSEPAVKVCTMHFVLNNVIYLLYELYFDHVIASMIWSLRS